MTLIGLGLDVTEISRITYMIERYGARFKQRIFTDGEIAYCERRKAQASSFAARFAAKEAAMKALGTGRSRGVLWRDIEVVRTYGPPHLRFHGGARHGGDYSHQALAAEARRLRRVIACGVDAYVYFNNDARAFAIADAARLRRYLEG